jgi:hypothetical protein
VHDVDPNDHPYANQDRLSLLPVLAAAAGIVRRRRLRADRLLQRPVPRAGRESGGQVLRDADADADTDPHVRHVRDAWMLQVLDHLPRRFRDGGDGVQRAMPDQRGATHRATGCMCDVHADAAADAA